MTPVGSNVFQRVKVLLLLDNVGARVVAFTPQHGMHMVSEHELIFDRSFSDEKSAAEFLSSEGLCFTTCCATGAKVYCMVMPRGYTRESQHREVYQCRFFANFKEKEPKFPTKKDAGAFYAAGHNLFGLEISNEMVFQSRAELKDFLDSENRKMPNLSLEEETMEWPLKGKLSQMLWFAVAVLVGIGVGAVWR